MGFDDLAGVLRSRGLRLTAPRQLVLESVYRLRHATPDQIHADVAERAAGVNITTVYRTLELLEELELVTHAHLSHGAPTYHPMGEHQHAHLVCRACGEVQTLDAPTVQGLADDLARTRGFRLDIGHVALFGVCADCTGTLNGAGEAHTPYGATKADTPSGADQAHSGKAGSIKADSTDMTEATA